MNKTEIVLLDLLAEAVPADEAAENEAEASRPFDVETRALETPEILLGKFLTKILYQNFIMF
jgi:hypothetical protein